MLDVANDPLVQQRCVREVLEVPSNLGVLVDLVVVVVFELLVVVLAVGELRPEECSEEEVQIDLGFGAVPDLRVEVVVLQPRPDFVGMLLLRTWQVPNEFALQNLIWLQAKAAVIHDLEDCRNVLLLLDLDFHNRDTIEQIRDVVGQLRDVVAVWGVLETKEGVEVTRDRREVLTDSLLSLISWFNTLRFNDLTERRLPILIEDLEASGIAKVIALEDQLLKRGAAERLLVIVGIPIFVILVGLASRFECFEDLAQTDENQKERREPLLAVNNRNVRGRAVGQVRVQKVRLEMLLDSRLDLTWIRLLALTGREAGLNVTQERLDVSQLPLVLTLVDVDVVRLGVAEDRSQELIVRRNDAPDGYLLCWHIPNPFPSLRRSPDYR